MKIVLLKADGEKIEREDKIKDFGYSVETFEATQDISKLKYECTDEVDKFIYPTELKKSNKPYTVSLRASFANMLEAHIDDDDFTVFGESDAIPLISASKLEECLHPYINNPHVDVIRLYDKLVYIEQDNRCFDSSDFKQMLQTETSVNNATVWGTHAVIIPKRSRAKVINLFRTINAPIDTTLEYAWCNNKITVYSATNTLFAQVKRTSKANSKKLWSYRKRRFALCMASYKRPLDIIRQIQSMMEQTYDKDMFHLFVAVKGIPIALYSNYIIPFIKKYIDEGRLTIRVASNTNQLSNFIDCTRALDVDDYEYFVKIDDDDLYNPEYLDKVNTFLATLPEGFSALYEGNTHCLIDRGGYILPGKKLAVCFGASMVMHKDVYNLIRRSETDPEFVRRIMKEGSGRDIKDISYSEDHLYKYLMRKCGMDNMAGKIDGWLIATNDINNSVTNGNGYVPEELRKTQNVYKKEYEDIVAVVDDNKDRSGYLRIYVVAKKAINISTGAIAKVVEYTKDSLKLDWDYASTILTCYSAKNTLIYAKSSEVVLD